MKVVILAGGYGTRLRPLTYTKPKSMLPLLDKPVLQHIVEWLAAQGFDDILVATNYLREQILDYFGDGTAHGVRMVYPKEDRPLGTAGAVKNVDELLNETFVVVQGDGVTEIKVSDAVASHEEKGGIGTLLLTHVDNPREYGIVEMDSTANIIRFQEKPRPEACFSNLINTGIYILEPEVLKYIPEKSKYDFAHDLFPKLLAMGQRLHGYHAPGFWIDIGRPEQYLKAIRWTLRRSRDMRIPEPEGARSSLRKIPKYHEMVAQRDTEATIGEITMLGTDCHIGEGVIFDGYSVIERNVDIGDGVHITNSVIYSGSHIGSSSHIEHSIVAEKCHIGSHVKIAASVVGAYCKVGDKVVVPPRSKIWPKSEIDVQSTVGGTIHRPRKTDSKYVGEVTSLASGG